MQVNSVNLNDLTATPIDPDDPEASASKANPTGLGRDDFLRMLVAQLEHQDPLNPQDGTEFTAQLAQFSSLEQLISIRENLDGLAKAQRDLSGAMQSLASGSLIGREAVVRGSRMELGSDGALRVSPAFELASASTATALLVHAASGHVLERVELGPQGRGFHRVPESALAKLGLAAGEYEFSIEAASNGQPVEAALHAVGVITGSAPSDDGATLQLGGLTVPFSEVREIREREASARAAAAGAGADPDAAAPAAKSAAPDAASGAGAGPGEVSAEAAAGAAVIDAALARAERLASAAPPLRTGRPQHSSALTGKAASNPAPARLPAIG